MLYIQNPKIRLKKFTLTLLKMRQLPFIEKIDWNDECSCLIWTIHNGRRKVCLYDRRDRDRFNIVVYRNQSNIYWKNSEVELKKRTMKNYFPNESIFWATLTYFSSGAMYWMKQLYIFKTTSSGNDVFFLMIIFRLCPGSNCLLNTIVLVAKFFSQMHVSVGMLDFLYVSLKILYLVAMVTSTSNTFFVISKFSDYMQ